MLAYSKLFQVSQENCTLHFNSWLRHIRYFARMPNVGKRFDILGSLCLYSILSTSEGRGEKIPCSEDSSHRLTFNEGCLEGRRLSKTHGCMDVRHFPFFRLSGLEHSQTESYKAALPCGHQANGSLMHALGGVLEQDAD